MRRSFIIITNLKGKDMIDVKTIPSIYSIKESEGTCMLPVIRPGTKLAFSREEKIKVGDVVGIWFREGKQPGAHQLWVKKLHRYIPRHRVTPEIGLAPAASFEAINTGILYHWGIDTIEAMHKCVGYMDSDGKLVRVDYADKIRMHSTMIPQVA